MKKISIICLSAFLLLTNTGCLKDKGFEDNKYGLKNPENSPVSVGFPESANKSNIGAIESSASPTLLKLALVNLNSDQVAEQDIHINLIRDTSLIGVYNRDAANATNQLTEFADAAISTTLKVVIPKGQTKAFLNLTLLNSASLDLTQTYAIGLRISSVDEAGVVVSALQQTVISGVAIKNPYDGVYNVKSYTLRSGDAPRTGNPVPFEMGLVTVGAYANQFAGFHKWADASSVGIGNPVYTIDPATNIVTVTAVNTTVTVIDAPGYTNKYDPASRTFYAAYTWGAGPTSRLILDTLTYLRPR